jgi:hypothetical protein
MTLPTLRRHTSGPITHTASQMAHNNISDPNMGKAYQPYARSVQQLRPLPQNMFPDASLVFDTLLKREKVWPPSSGILTRPFTCIVSVRHAPSRAVQLYVFVRGARGPYVSLAFSRLTRISTNRTFL